MNQASISLAQMYPRYYKSVGTLKEVDVYAVHQLFNIQDPSGAIQHASKKLLLSGVRTGGKSQFDDIREARDTLNRWLELNATAPAELVLTPNNWCGEIPMPRDIVAQFTKQQEHRKRELDAVVGPFVQQTVAPQIHQREPGCGGDSSYLNQVW